MLMKMLLMPLPFSNLSDQSKPCCAPRPREVTLACHGHWPLPSLSTKQQITGTKSSKTEHNFQAQVEFQTIWDQVNKADHPNFLAKFEIQTGLSLFSDLYLSILNNPSSQNDRYVEESDNFEIHDLEETSFSVGQGKAEVTM